MASAVKGGVASLLDAANARAGARYAKMSVDERKKLAAEEKDKGNKLFTQGNYARALECYEESILLDATNPIYFGNASQCYIKLKKFKEAIKRADEALNLDPKFVKVLMRRATAHSELGQHDKAIDDLRAALHFEPKNSAIQVELDRAIDTFNAEKAKKQAEELRKQLAAQASVKKPGTSRQPQNPPTFNSSAADEFELPEPEITPKPIQSPTPAQALSSTSAVSPQKTNPVVTPITPASAPAPAPTIAAVVRVPTAAPKFFYLFEQDYNGIKSRPDLLANYYKLIKPESIPQLFKESLTSDIFASFLGAMKNHYLPAGEVEITMCYLENFLKTPRFSLVLMCLSDEQTTSASFSLLKDTFKGIRESGKSFDEAKLASLEKAYNE